MAKEALAVKRETLFNEGGFQGFVSIKDRDFVADIIQNHSYYARGEELEHDASLKQVIPYVWIINPETKKVFLYKRAFNANKEEGEFREERYMNNYSGGVGGHIDRDTEEGSENPVEKAMLRELAEEVVMSEKLTPKIIGFINDDSDSLGEVHFGVVAIARTAGEVKAKEEEGLISGGFYSVEEAEKIFSSPENKVENWTRISWPFIRNYLAG